MDAAIRGCWLFPIDALALRQGGAEEKFHNKRRVVGWRPAGDATLVDPRLDAFIKAKHLPVICTRLARFHARGTEIVELHDLVVIVAGILLKYSSCWTPYPVVCRTQTAPNLISSIYRAQISAQHPYSAEAS